MKRKPKTKMKWSFPVRGRDAVITRMKMRKGSKRKQGSDVYREIRGTVNATAVSEMLLTDFKTLLKVSLVDKTIMIKVIPYRVELDAGKGDDRLYQVVRHLNLLKLKMTEVNFIWIETRRTSS